MTPTDATDRARLRVDVATAARLVAPVWPLERFVAVNPLLGLVEQGFDEAVTEARRWLGAGGYPGVAPSPTGSRTVLERLDPARAASVDRLLARWYPLLVDPHGPFAHRDRLRAWRRLAAADRTLRRLAGPAMRTDLATLPDRADEAILAGLGRLGVTQADRPDELRGQLARLPGWAGYARWCDEWASPDDPAPRIQLLELLAIAITTDALVAPGAPGVPNGTRVSDPEQVDASSKGRLVAAEETYRHSLLSQLSRSPVGPDSTLGAQVVCCIDVRSEPLRRHLEDTGPYDTYGFAGFFATPIRYRPLGSAEAYPSAPVLLQPDTEVAEVPDPAAPAEADAAVRARSRRAGAAGAVHALAHGPLSMYALAETSGWILGPLAAARTFRPRLRDAGPGPATIVDTGSFPLEEQTTILETALRTMGLTHGFAPLVVLCGHRATSTANPHAAALDCGACGGNRGGPNARTLATIANDPAVRNELAERGLVIPPGTWFAAAEHDTTVDTITFLDASRCPGSHRAIVEQLTSDLAIAGRRCATERAARFPGTGRTAHPRVRAADWAQTRPEWGLARNAAFVVAPRDRTRGLDLGGRVFLHSYDDHADDDGTALETILTAPMVVAHWINAQYYFSTVDPDVYGAGDKTLHNPVAGIGVLTGAAGDLRIGLPWQSVADVDGPYHEPLRLLTVVQAPIQRIDAVVDRNPILQHLFNGAWVHLVALDGDHARWERRVDGHWHPLPVHPSLPAAQETPA